MVSAVVHYVGTFECVLFYFRIWIAFTYLGVALGAGQITTIFYHLVYDRVSSSMATVK